MASPDNTRVAKKGRLSRTMTVPTRTTIGADGPDVRPVTHMIGHILVGLALTMVVPAAVDWSTPNRGAFIQASGLTGIVGLLLTIATRDDRGRALDIRQAYLLIFGIWTIVPAFGCLPFMFGAPGLSLTDAYFEAVSGITTTGATVIVGLDGLPDGMNLWRGMLNWLGGLGIAFIAMIFLPVMRVGGMQFFRTERFDTMDKIMPRAADIARSLLVVYAALTMLFIATYLWIGMSPLDSVVNGLATVSTGGFSPSDASFAKYPGAAEYFGALFMAMSALPFILYVHLLRGQARPMLKDPQAAGFISALLVAVWGVALWQALTSGMGLEQAFRESLFNLTSIMSGTGFHSGSFAGWEGPALIVAFALGLSGGCSGSSSGGLSVFRVQLAVVAVASQIKMIQSPSRIVPIRYDGRTVAPDVIDALMLYVTGYILILGVMTVLMTVVGVDAYSAVIGVWQALGNIGYEFGPLTTATGTFVDYPDAAKWIMTVSMLLGRLGLLTMVVVVLPRFWRG